MTTGDVCYSVSDFGKVFIRNYKNEKVRQIEIDAIVIDFINYFASRYSIDLMMTTDDLRSSRRIKNEYAILDRKLIEEHLNYHKKSYFTNGITESILRNNGMNKLDGTCDCTDEDAEEIVESFISAYLKSEINTPSYIIDARKARRFRRNYDRQVTVKLFLTKLAYEYLTNRDIRDEVSKLISSTYFVSLEQFNLVVDTMKEKGYRKNYFTELRQMQVDDQKLYLNKLVVFLKDTKLFEKYKL